MKNEELQKTKALLEKQMEMLSKKSEEEDDGAGFALAEMSRAMAQCAETYSHILCLDPETGVGFANYWPSGCQGLAEEEMAVREEKGGEPHDGSNGEEQRPD